MDLKTKDINTLTQLYLGNHLDQTELERVDYLIKMLRMELNRRIKEELY